MNRRGTNMRFKPDEKIFGKGCAFKPARLFKMARSKAYLFGGVEIRWKCDPSLITDDTPAKAVFHFPGGLKDYLLSEIEGQTLVTKEIFAGRTQGANGHGSVEWAVAWIADEDGFLRSYCNTIPTPDGGTHETGLRQALSKGLRAYGELTEQPPRRADHRRRRDGHRRGDARRLHPRAGVPGPDQGPARHAGGDPHRREHRARRLRPLARRQPRAGDEAPRLGDRPGRGAPEAQAREGDRPPVGDAQIAPAGQARRLHHPGGRRHRDLHRRGRFRRRLGQERARPRDAGDPALARQDPQRGERLLAEARGRTSCWPTSSRRSAPAPAPSIATRTCATSASSS